MKIEKSAREEFTVFVLSGRIEADRIAELNELFEVQPARQSIVVDLKDVKLADREAVRFLARCEADGVRLENCPAYIHEWMEREKD